MANLGWEKVQSPAGIIRAPPHQAEAARGHTAAVRVHENGAALEANADLRDD